MSKGPIRRGQLIAPFGVGALVVVKDGTSVLSGGLDHWYVPEGGLNAAQEIDAAGTVRRSVTYGVQNDLNDRCNPTERYRTTHTDKKSKVIKPA